MQLTWTLKTFNDLTANELYHILRLRSEVFVVEQNCVFLDADNKDQVAHHYMCWGENELLAYTRLLPAGFAYEYVSIGRVVTSPRARSLGIGKLLMRQSIDECVKLFNADIIKIGAQLYLKKFYESFGFTQSSEIYVEDGIDHIEMLLTIS
jgi:ElaA protein